MSSVGMKKLCLGKFWSLRTMDFLSIRPYSFEPMYEEGEEPSDSDSSDEEFEGNEDNSRLGRHDWCKCGTKQP